MNDTDPPLPVGPPPSEPAPGPFGLPFAPGMLPPPPMPAYRVHTPRLVIRCWDPADAPLLEATVSASLEHLRPWLPWTMEEPMDLTRRVERLRHFRGHFDLGIDFAYGIFDRGEKEVLGGIGRHPRAGEGSRDVGYWLGAAHAGRGIATEAAAALTRVAFEVDRARRVEIRCDPLNRRSSGVPERLGFTHEGTLRRHSPAPDGTLRDTMIWALLADELPASPAAGAEREALDAAGRRIL